jgi:hypothetical protein
MHSQTEQYRITIYCDSQGQKEFIQNLLHNEKIKNQDKKIGDTLERLLILEQRTLFLKMKKEGVE